MSLQSPDNILNVKNAVIRVNSVEADSITANNVSEGILNAIYPVGTILDRATAITDTHLNGKYKAFLTAPNQEWELVDDGENKVLEILNSPCDSTSLFGRATMEHITAAYNLTTSFTSIGSTISNYTPPIGTKSVTFRFSASWIHQSSNEPSPFPTFRLELAEGLNSTAWNVIENSYQSYYWSGAYSRDTAVMVWTIDLGVGTSNDYNKGTLVASRPVLNLRWNGREHASSTHEVTMHLAYKHTSDGSSGGNHAFSTPQVSVTAIGTKSLEYKRTV